MPCPHKDKLHKQWCLFDQDHQNHHHQDHQDHQENELDEIFDLRKVEEEGKSKVNKGNFLWDLTESKVVEGS